jgi:hypothetical protein
VVVRLSLGKLVRVFDAGQVAGEIFIALDFVDGLDLRAVWNRCGQVFVPPDAIGQGPLARRAESHRWGFVNRVLPADALMDEAREICNACTARSVWREDED